ncbi:MAG: DUF86 domain-containing protein [Caldilineaceae bacterium]|nr:DUF86 domain-containing protein [Caldilineaceae bacterium]
MRSDDALLLDMLIAARKIRRFVTGMTVAEFRVNEMVQSAVIRELQVIGEASRVITDATRVSCTGINWRAMAGMRNRLVHEYFSVQLEVVWKTVQDDIVPLISQLERYIPPDLGITE